MITFKQFLEEQVRPQYFYRSIHFDHLIDALDSNVLEPNKLTGKSSFTRSLEFALNWSGYAYRVVVVLDRNKVLSNNKVRQYSFFQDRKGKIGHKAVFVDQREEEVEGPIRNFKSKLREIIIINDRKYRLLDVYGKKAENIFNNYNVKFVERSFGQFL